MMRIQQSGLDCWVVQKYIERPLVILGRKFDMRVWVVVTSVDPLTIWMWRTPYMRFTSQNYDPSNVRNQFQHLTNASITKKDKSSGTKKKGKHVIKNNMWETH